MLAQALGQLEQLAVLGAVKAQHGPVMEVVQRQRAQLEAALVLQYHLGLLTLG
jgi:hypothetical protein